MLKFQPKMIFSLKKNQIIVKGKWNFLPKCLILKNENENENENFTFYYGYIVIVTKWV